MPIRRSSAVLFVASALAPAACAGGRTLPAHTESRPATAEPADAAESSRAEAGPEAAAAPDPCGRIGAAQRDGLARIEGLLGRDADAAAAPEAALPPETVAFFGACVPTRGGAWGNVLRDPRVEGDAIVAAWDVVHVSRDGAWSAAAATARPAGTGAGFGCAWWACPVLDPPVAFDYDGDGEEEIVVTGGGHVHEGASFDVGLVFGWKDGAVRPYGPARAIGFHRATDVDGDGRPDLIGHGPFDATPDSPCSGFEMRAVGPDLLWHAVAGGGFDASDAAAAAFARRSCPAPPRDVVPREGGRVDDGAAFRAVACARLWGQPERRVEQAVRAGCALRGAAAICPGHPSACIAPDVLLAWARAEPPVRLR